MAVIKQRIMQVFVHPKPGTGLGALRALGGNPFLRNKETSFLLMAHPCFKEIIRCYWMVTISLHRVTLLRLNACHVICALFRLVCTRYIPRRRHLILLQPPSTVTTERRASIAFVTLPRQCAGPPFGTCHPCDRGKLILDLSSMWVVGSVDCRFVLLHSSRKLGVPV